MLSAITKQATARFRVSRLWAPLWRRLPLSAPDLTLDGVADQVGTLLFLGQHGINPRERSGREARGSLLVIDSSASHAGNN